LGATLHAPPHSRRTSPVGVRRPEHRLPQPPPESLPLPLPPPLPPLPPLCVVLDAAESVPL